MYNSIKRFSEILSISNGLYVFDIDETFMVYRGITDLWWKKKFNYLLNIHTIEQAEIEMDKIFGKIIHKELPNPTDIKGFKDIEEKSKKLNNDIIFLTARPEKYREITLKHLSYIYPGIDYKVYFSKEKGNKLKEILESSNKKYENVVFVDDKKYNIIDVLEKNPIVKCYKFNYMEYIYNFSY